MSETDPSHNHRTFPGSPSIFNPESLLNLKAPPQDIQMSETDPSQDHMTLARSPGVIIDSLPDCDLKSIFYDFTPMIFHITNRFDTVLIKIKVGLVTQYKHQQTFRTDSVSYLKVLEKHMYVQER